MPAGKGAASTKAASRSRARPEEPSSCQMQIGGPTLVLRTNVSVESSVDTNKSGQAFTCGQRIGHVATMVPNQKGIIAVIGGVALASAAPDPAMFGGSSLSGTLPSVVELLSGAAEVANPGEVGLPSCMNANRSNMSDATLPPLKTCTSPLVEFYHIASRRWSVPGIARVEKWPAQSATAVLWDIFNPEGNPSESDRTEPVEEQQDLVELQSTNGEWNLKRFSLVLAKIPALVCAVGGWDGQRRFASAQLYVDEAAKGCGEAPSSCPAVSILPFPESVPPISGHSCEVVGGKLYIFGGTTLYGCSNTVHELHITSNNPDWAPMCGNSSDTAGLDVASFALVEEIDSVRETAIQVSSTTPLRGKTTVERIPAPAPRSAHASCCLDDRILLFFGGRRLMLEDPPNPTKRHVSNSTRSKAKSNSGRNSTRAGGAGLEVQLPWNLRLEVFNDVIAYDTETCCWLPVQLTGGSAPCPRYGAAMCVLPSSGREGEAPTKEILVYGGVDASGSTLSDAWILYAKKSSSGKEMKIDMPEPAAGAGRRTEPLQFVWARLDLTPLCTATALSSPSAQAAFDLSRAYHAAVVIAHQKRMREVLLVGGYVQETVPAACMLRLSIPPFYKAGEV